MVKDARERLHSAWGSWLAGLLNEWRLFAAREGALPLRRVRGNPSEPPVCDGVQEFMDHHLDRLNRLGNERMADSQWWDNESRCYVGHHLLRAEASIRAHLPSPLPASHSQALFQALHALRASRARCWETYIDEYNFMAGAHNDIMRPLMDERLRLGLGRPWEALEPWEPGWVEEAEALERNSA